MHALQFEIVAAIVGICALLFFYLSFKILLSVSWFWGWLKGNLAIVVLLSAVALLLALIDLRTYRPMFNEQAIATISVNTLAPGNHQIRLVDSEGIESVYAITGDRYRLYFNQFRLAPQYANMGLGHGYRLQTIVTESLNSDANSQEGEFNKLKVPEENSVYVDVWKAFNRCLPSDWIVSAHSIETASQIVVDNAVYELVANVYSIDIKPLNQIAVMAESNKTLNKKTSITRVTDKTGRDTELMTNTDSISLPVGDDDFENKNKPSPVEEPSAVLEVKVEKESPADPLSASPSASGNTNFGKIIRKPAGSHIKATPAEVITPPSSAE